MVLNFYSYRFFADSAHISHDATGTLRSDVVAYQCFGGPCCLHLRVTAISIFITVKTSNLIYHLKHIMVKGKTTDVMCEDHTTELEVVPLITIHWPCTCPVPVSFNLCDVLPHRNMVSKPRRSQLESSITMSTSGLIYINTFEFTPTVDILPVLNCQNTISKAKDVIQDVVFKKQLGRGALTSITWPELFYMRVKLLVKVMA